VYFLLVQGKKGTKKKIGSTAMGLEIKFDGKVRRDYLLCSTNIIYLFIYYHLLKL